MNSFRIVKYKSGIRSTFYSIKFENEKYSEAQKFFNKYGSIKPLDVSTIDDNIDFMATKHGCLDIFFEHEGSMQDNVRKLKIGDVRLYCLRYGNIAVILGGGGIKIKRKTQDNPELQEHVDLLKLLCKEVDKLIREKEIDYSDNEIIGIEDKEFNLT